MTLPYGFESSSYSEPTLKMEHRNSRSSLKRRSHDTNLFKRVEAENRSRSFERPRRDKLVAESRSKSDGALTQDAPAGRMHDKVSSVFSHFKKKKAPVQEVPLQREESSTDLSLSFDNQLKIICAPTHSMSFGEELSEPFVFHDVHLAFPEPVQKLMIDFIDVDQVKNAIIRKNFKNLDTINNFNKVIADLEELSKNAVSDRKKKFAAVKLERINERLMHFKTKNGTIMRKSKSFREEDVEIIGNPQLGSDPFKEPGCVFLEYKCIVKLKDSDHEFTFSKTASITKDPVGLYVIEPTGSNLKRS